MLTQNSPPDPAPEGKAISSLNALKTGLTGRTVVLPSDDTAAYQQHIAAYEAEYKPVGLRECELVQSLADSRWRLNRIPKLEAAIYAQGRAEFAAGFDDDGKDEAAASQRAEDSNNVQLQTYLQYEKQLKNLHLQEARLNRRFDKDLAELRKLQTQRMEQENGFEFSTAEREPKFKSGADDLVVYHPAPQRSTDSPVVCGPIQPVASPVFEASLWAGSVRPMDFTPES